MDEKAIAKRIAAAVDLPHLEIPLYPVPMEREAGIGLEPGGTSCRTRNEDMPQNFDGPQLMFMPDSEWPEARRTAVDDSVKARRLRRMQDLSTRIVMECYRIGVVSAKLESHSSDASSGVIKVGLRSKMEKGWYSFDFNPKTSKKGLEMVVDRFIRNLEGFKPLGMRVKKISLPVNSAPSWFPAESYETNEIVVLVEFAGSVVAGMVGPSKGLGESMEEWKNEIAARVAGSVLERVERDMGKKVDVRSSGKAIAERLEEGGYLILMPDGDVENAANRVVAERKVRGWFKRNRPEGLGIGIIEWR